MLESYDRRPGPRAARYASEVVETPAPLSVSWERGAICPLARAAVRAPWRRTRHTCDQEEPEAVTNEVLFGELCEPRSAPTVLVAKTYSEMVEKCIVDGDMTAALRDKAHERGRSTGAMRSTAPCFPR
jgi:hypothetical protein